MKRSDTPISYISKKGQFLVSHTTFGAPNHNTHKTRKARADMVWGGGFFSRSLKQRWVSLVLSCNLDVPIRTHTHAAKKMVCPLAGSPRGDRVTCPPLTRPNQSAPSTRPRRGRKKSAHVHETSSTVPYHSPPRFSSLTRPPFLQTSSFHTPKLLFAMP